MSDELRNTAFSSKFKGYDPEQVEDFIDKVLECYDSLAEEYVNLENNFKELTEKIGDIEKTKSDAVKLVSAAKLEGEAMIEAAKKQANKIIAAAVADADGISRDAQIELSSQARAISELEKERERLREDIIRICSDYIKNASAIEANTAIDSILEEIGSEIAAEPLKTIAKEAAPVFQKREEAAEAEVIPDAEAFEEEEKPANPFDTSFLRPASGDGDPQAKIYTRSTRVGGFIQNDEDERAPESAPIRQRQTESSTIADLATSLKTESREASEGMFSAKTEKRMSYDEMMRSLGETKKNGGGRDPLKFIK